MSNNITRLLDEVIALVGGREECRPITTLIKVSELRDELIEQGLYIEKSKLSDVCDADELVDIICDSFDGDGLSVIDTVLLRKAIVKRFPELS
jgi:hypothetical protein